MSGLLQSAKVYWVNCGRCNEFLDLDKVSDFIVDSRSASDYLRSKGWVKTKESGWVCPKCAKKVTK